MTSSFSRPNELVSCSTESPVSSGCRAHSLPVIGSRAPPVHIVDVDMEIIVISMEITKPHFVCMESIVAGDPPDDLHRQANKSPGLGRKQELESTFRSTTCYSVLLAHNYRLWLMSVLPLRPVSIEEWRICGRHFDL